MPESTLMIDALHLATQSTYFDEWARSMSERTSGGA